MKQKLRLFTSLLLLAVASVAWGDTYEQLTSIANIDESAQYVLGDAEKGFHYSGTSSWGMIAQPNVQTPLYYTLKKGSDGTTFTAVTTIEEQEYYLTVPTSKTFTMSLSETSIGMATGGGIKNATSTTVWLIRVNTNLRAYSTATGSVAYFYKVVSDGVATTTTAINVPADFNTDVHTSTTAGQLTATVSANGTAISGAVVTWESSNEGVATIDASGNVILVAAGTTTITATYAGVDGQYEGSSATYELTVTDSSPFEGGDVTFDATADKGTSPLTKKVVTLTASNGVLDNGTEYRFYKSSATTISVPEGYYISQIVFTCTAEGQAQYGPGCFSLTNTQPGVYSYSGNEGTWIGNASSVTFTASLNQVRATQIVVTVGSGTIKADPELSFSAATATATLGEAFTAPTLTNSHELSVSYSSSNENVATVDETTGAVTLVDAGETTITATFAGNDTYSAGAASYTLTVNAPAVAESDWVKAELSSLTEGDVFVIVGNNGNNYALANDKGTSAAPTAVSVTVNGDYLTSEVADNIKWNVSGNATDGYTFYPNGSTTTWLYCTNDNNGVRVGDNNNKTFKVAEGYLQHDGTSRYVGVYNSSDWRCYTSINNNIKNQTFAFYKYTGAPAPSITADDRNITYDITEGEISYTVNNPVEGGVLTAATEADWLTMGEVGAAAVAFTATQNETALTRTAEVVLTYTYGTATTSKTITVTQTGNPNASGTENNPYTVSEALEVIATLADGGKTENVYTTGTITQIQEVSVYDEATEQGYGNATYFISDGTNELEVFRGFYLDNTKFTSENQIEVGDVVVVYGQLQKYVKNETVTPEIAQGNNIVSLDRPEPVTVTIKDAGYATFANEKAVDFSAETDLTVLTAKYDADKDKIVYNEVTSKKVPAGKAVVLKGAAGTYTGNVIASADELVNNGLKVNLTEDTPATGKEYCLARLNGVVGFYKVATSTYVKAGKAYLEIERPATTGGAKDFYAIEDETDGINAINNSHQTVESVYNLSGQRVNKAQKGVYIVNGKKVVVK